MGNCFKAEKKEVAAAATPSEAITQEAKESPREIIEVSDPDEDEYDKIARKITYENCD